MSVPSEPLAVRAIDLGTGHEHLVFFAADEADLPDDEVESELEVVATVNGAEQARGAGLDLLRDLSVNLVSNAAWTGLLATLTATTTYLHSRSRRARTQLDTAQVMDRVNAACLRILKRSPGGAGDVDIRREPDGTWTVFLGLDDETVEATLDDSGIVMLFHRESREAP